ncbi:carboxypeptidase N subunit 2-like [Diorhabda sublineata]|uniref:carboxypeptidase N subunit 2-like n=1 Tax=Diorhabda sublineata TaxID=1163346 RepID=UPI0024E0F948|nr:carboxypeptidase N subunit 2-like [Diorhabda sublineata]
MGFYLRVITLLMVSMSYVQGGFLYGQPCTIRNTAYLRVGEWSLPTNDTKCVDVTGFKMNLHGRINLANYTKFFEEVEGADTLYADHLNLTHFPIMIVKSLPNVETIDLSGNRIKLIPPKMFKLAPKIQKLLFDDNRIAIPRRKPLISSHSLKTLMLSNNNIAFIYQSTFSKLPSLEVLYLDNNNIQDISPLFKKMPNLKFLHVGRNVLNYIPAKKNISDSLISFITKSQKTLLH